MNIDVEQHVLYRIANAPIMEFPFPHLYVDKVFPEDYYRQMLQNLPSDTDYTSIADTGRTGKSYRDRYIISLRDDAAKLTGPAGEFWRTASSWLLGNRFMSTLLDKFAPYMDTRMAEFNGEQLVAEESALLVRDRTGYSIGPHTDAKRKLLTLLFYIPEDARYEHLGTSIYVPKKAGMTCPGGPHYAFEDFKKVTTASFLPNTLFAFFKTDDSFHGVEVIETEAVERNLIIYNVNLRQLQPQDVSLTNYNPV